MEIFREDHVEHRTQQPSVRVRHDRHMFVPPRRFRKPGIDDDNAIALGNDVELVTEARRRNERHMRDDRVCPNYDEHVGFIEIGKGEAGG